MKKILLIFILFLIPEVLAAQRNYHSTDAFRLGLNCGFFTHGDIYMPAVSADYIHSLNDFMAVSPGIIIARHNRVNKGLYKYSESLAAALSLQITPLPGIFDNLKIDIGGLYHHFKTSSMYIYFTGQDNHVNYDYYIGDHFGFIGSLNVDFSIKKKIFYGGRFDLLSNYLSGKLSYESIQGGIYIGIKI